MNVLQQNLILTVHLPALAESLNLLVTFFVLASQDKNETFNQCVLDRHVKPKTPVMETAALKEKFTEVLHPMNSLEISKRQGNKVLRARRNLTLRISVS